MWGGEAETLCRVSGVKGPVGGAGRSRGTGAGAPHSQGCRGKPWRGGVHVVRGDVRGCKFRGRVGRGISGVELSLFCVGKLRAVQREVAGFGGRRYRPRSASCV